VSEHDFKTMRQAMVANQLRTNSVNDPRITAAIDNVPREAFVPADRAALAYVDVAIPLGGGRSLNTPMATARLLTEAGLRSADKVLLIGAATGYAAMLLAQVVSHVTAVEEDPALSAAIPDAARALEKINFVNGPLTNGWQDGAPYDVVIVDGAVAELGEALSAQLVEGGRLLTGIVDKGVTRLARGVRAGNAVNVVPFADVETVTLPGFERPVGFTF
jgi:protein-L-isoaspartate(D-aspartate) O-methyltransferase